MIYETSKSYAFLKNYVSFIHSLFYRRIYINGVDNISGSTPIIFAPNHQNALMDPLALILSTPLQPVFLARADIFKSSINRPILHFLKMLPVYRIRDGLRNVENNDKTFDETVKILEAKKQLALFPEARHHGQHFLLPLKKAIPRIAMMAEEKNNFKLNLQIIPVGIHYSDYYSYKSDMWIQFGDPILVNDLKIINNTHPLQAQLILKERISEAIKPLILNIEDKTHYDTYNLLIGVAHNKMCRKLSSPNKLNKNTLMVQQETIKHIQNLETTEKQNILSLGDEFLKQLKTINLSPEDILDQSKLKIINLLQLTLTLPFFIIGIIPSIPHALLAWFLYKNKNDKQFESSYKFILALILSPITFGIIAFFLLPKVFNINLMVSIGSFFLLFYISSYAFNYWNLLKKTIHRIGKIKTIKLQNSVIANYKSKILNYF